jgi:thermitase
MKQIICIISGLLLWYDATTQVSEPFVPNEIIIKFEQRPDVQWTDNAMKKQFEIPPLDSLNNKYGMRDIELTGNKKNRKTFLLRFEATLEMEEIIKEYTNTGLFEYVEPNYIGGGGGKQGLVETFPSDGDFSRQWGLYNDGTFSLSAAIIDADIDMEMAWDVEQGNASIVIAVLDGGMKLDHPEVSGRLWENSDESSNSEDDDENGYADDIRGWDFAYSDNDPTDDYGHGTNVTGIIGAEANNEIGFAGVDWNARLMICKILDQDNWGLYTWWAEAIYYAVDNGANVINMSVGGSNFSSILKEAVDYAYSKGVIIVACMMNDDNSIAFYPAGYQNTIAVGSTNPNDERTSPFFWSSTSGSNYGDHIDVVAPGNYIYGLHYLSNTNYNTYWGGTSQATPLVSGLCALLLAQEPNRTPDDIREIIRNTAEDQVGDPTEDKEGFDIYYGYGRINTHQALLYQSTQVVDLHAETDDLMIYPNPSDGLVFIEGNDGIKIISIINLYGKEVFRKELSAKEEIIALDISGLSQGAYLIIFSNGQGERMRTQSLIIE